MKNLGYYNGKYDLIENMYVPMNDRACFFGDGIYEVAYARNYIIYALDEHLDRLYESAKQLYINIPYTKERLTEIIYELVRKLDDGEQIVYIQISRGTQMRNHTPSNDLCGNLWITLRHMKLRDSYSKMTLITTEDTRFLMCNMKTLNLLPAVLASRLAEEAGVDEAVLYRGDYITECAHSNISIITENNEIKTAPVTNMILPGVSRAHLLSTARELRIPVIEEAFTINEMMTAKEIIVTASGAPCRGVREINGIAVGGRAPELLKRLQDIILGDFYNKTNI